MSIGVLLRGFIGDMMDFGDVILRALFPSFMAIQACSSLSLKDDRQNITQAQVFEMTGAYCQRNVY